MKNKTAAFIQEPVVGPTDRWKLVDNRKYKITIVILTVLCILGIISSSVCCFLLARNSSEISQLRAELEEREQYIASIPKDGNEPSGIDQSSTNDGEKASSDPEPVNGLYWELSKIGMRVPVTQELLDNITLVDLGDGYRLDLNLLVKYREQGYCANGGSTALGNITKNNVSRDSVLDELVLYNFVNNVVYPKTYIAYNWYGESAMCWDLGEGGQARHDEVEQLVQRLQEPLTQAIEKIEPIK